MPDYQSLHDAEDEIRLEMAKYKSKLDKLYDK